MGIAKQRSFGVDALRVVAMLGVILLHSVQTVVFSCEGTSTLFWKSHLFVFTSLRWPVLIFFLVSGYLLPEVQPDTIRFYFRRFKKLLPPFIVWSIVFAYVRSTPNSTWQFDSNEFIFLLARIPVSMSYYHLWFMYDFFVLILCIPVLLYLVNRYEVLSQYWFIVAFGCLLFGAQYFYDVGHVGRIPVYIFYCYIGIFVRRRCPRFTIWVLPFGVAGIAINYVLAQGVVTSESCLDILSVLRYSFIQQLPIVLSCVLSLVYLKYKSDLFHRSIVEISKCSYGIYLMHPLFLWLFKLNVVGAYHLLPPVVFGLFVFVVLFGVSLGCTLLLRKSRMTSWLVP